MKKTPLCSLHRQLGARMTEFAGWEMPVQYEGALREHQAVRKAVALFDISHMGQLEIQGKDAIRTAQKVTCNEVVRLGDGQAQYSAFLSQEGTFIDDVVVYRHSAEHFFICVNAANKDKDFKWVNEQKEGTVEILDSSDRYALLAIQGPRAPSVLQQLTKADLSSIAYYRFTCARVQEVPALISRTGYTGEDGFEIYIPTESAESIWAGILKAGAPADIAPAGLAARNTLRLEVRYPLHGNDIDETTTPWEAGLGWIVKLEKGDFIGKEALQRQKEKGVSRKLVGFEMLDRGIARDHYPVYLEGQPAGHVTSGSFAPSLQKSIGLVYLPVSHAHPGQEVEVDIRGKRRRAIVVKTPFYQRK